MKAITWTVGGFLAAAALTGCGTSPKVANSNMASASIAFDGDTSSMGRVNRLATTECQKYGRLAVLQSIVPTDDGRIANYDCRTP